MDIQALTRATFIRSTLHWQDACHFADDIDKVGSGGHDKLGVLAHGLFHGFELAQYLGIADEVFLSRFINQPDRLSPTFSHLDGCFTFAFCTLDCRQFLLLGCLKLTGRQIREEG